MKKLILVCLLLISTDVYSVEKYFTSSGAGASIWNAGAWGGTRPSAGDNLHIHGTCIIDVNTGIDYGNLFLDDCELSGIILFTNENHTLSVNTVITNTSCAAVILTYGGFLRIRGDLKISNPSIIYEGEGAIEYQEGSVMPTYINTYRNLSIYTINGSVNLTLPITVKKKLINRSNHGIFKLGSYDLKIDSGGTIQGNGHPHFVDTDGTGRMIQFVGSSDVLFPIEYGDVFTHSNNSVKINNSGTPDWFAVRLKNSFINTPAPDNCLIREWDITEETPGGSNASLTFFWDSQTLSSNFDRNRRMAIATFDSSKWNEKNSSATIESGSTYMTTASGFTSFGFMTVKNKSKIILNITAIPEGFYNANSINLNQRDTVKTYLRNINSPYNILDSASGILDSLSFSVMDSFYNAPSGNYYIVIKHRNSLETWSKPGGIGLAVDSNYIYDFTISANQAYGNNLILIDTKYCNFSGDVNQDGVIDISDLSLIDDDVTITAVGYLNTDLDGNKIVDLSDMSIADNNTFNVVTIRNPVTGLAAENKIK